ncbi:MAG: peptidase S8/S53 domain-containing protein [Linnemannia elongata]|nr:MAG: peptidase S8/S53 domain-containing protein [Linnemannia elongata]
MKVAAILSALAAVTLVSAGTYHDLDGLVDANNVVPNKYIIEYHDGYSHSDARNALNSRKIDYKVRNEYDVFNGAAISVNSNHDGRVIASLPGVKNVWPITLHSIPKIQKSTAKATDPEAVSLHHMTGVDIVHRKLKLTGKGVKVGIIDTGVDYKHPAFAAKGATEGCFSRYGKDCRVKYGWDFVGDAYTGGNEPKPDSDPMDCQGHGSHVAGIVGGDARNITGANAPPQPFVGVAPEVTLGAYRVFGCTGNSGTDVLLAAMEKAFNDGMNIINMSLGGGSSYKGNPTAALGDKLAKMGLTLIASAGNDGVEGVWMVGNTGLGDDSTSVASFTNAYGRFQTFNYAGGKYSYSPAANFGKVIDLPASATLVPLFDKAGVLQDGCDAAAYTGVPVAGKVVLALGDYTRCGSGARATIAKNAGAAGLLTATTPVGMTNIGGIPGFPMASIENAAGDAVIAAYKKNAAEVITWSKTPSDVMVEGGGTISDFSSYGLDGDLRSKPDLGGPGGNILSTYPLANGGYAVLSGTSMSSPYVAGSQALFYQGKKNGPRGLETRKIFKNTATLTKLWKGKNLVSAAKQGSGLINVMNALTTTATLTPDHLDLLDTVNFRKTHKVTIKNFGKKTETYTLSHTPADALNSYYDGKGYPNPTIKFEEDFATVTFSQNKVKIPAGKSATITLNFAEPKNGDAKQFPIYSGYVIATPSTEGSPAVHIPYTGLKGDVSQVPMMDVQRGYPKLSQITDTGIVPAPAGKTWDFKKEVAVILYRLGSHTPDLSASVYDSNKVFKGYLNTSNGPAYGFSGRQKNVKDGQIIQAGYVWDGKVFTSRNSTAPVTLPSGTYSVVVAAQKKLTKGNYPADFEVYTFADVKW